MKLKQFIMSATTLTGLLCALSCDQKFSKLSPADRECVNRTRADFPLSYREAMQNTENMNLGYQTNYHGKLKQPDFIDSVSKSQLAIMKKKNPALVVLDENKNGLKHIVIVTPSSKDTFSLEHWRNPSITHN